MSATVDHLNAPAGSATLTRYCPECETRYEDEDEGLDHCPDDGKRLRVLVDEVDLDGDLIGRVLEGRWQIKARLGQGGMGTVFLATQKTVDRRVAVKMLKPALSSTKDYAERFMREANVATSLNNPHCVTVYDFGQTHDGLLYLAMELLEGRALSDVLRDSELSLRDILTVGTQICSALAAAHDGNIVHRDLKPDNIFLVDVPGGGIFCKVLDFGIAKVIDNNETPVTQTGQIFGTPAYMSPEQCHSADVDQRSDLYSLGVILYELVLGRPPFHHTTPIKTLMAHINSEVKPPSAVGVPVHERLERAILRLLEKEPDDRFDSALDVRREFEELIRDLSDEELATIPSRGVAEGEQSPSSPDSDPRAAHAETARGAAQHEGTDAPLNDAETSVYEDGGVEATETADREAPPVDERIADVSERGWSTALVVMVSVGAAVAAAAVVLWASGKTTTSSAAETTALDPSSTAAEDTAMEQDEAEVQEPAVALEENSPNSLDREMQPRIGAPDEEQSSANEADKDPSSDEAEPVGPEPDEPSPAELEVEPAKENEAPASPADENETEDEPSPALFENILTSASANRVIKSEYPAIQRCFQKGLAADPDFGGAVEIKMVVSETGAVTSSKVVSSDVDHDGVEQCIVDEARSWTFPRPGDGFYKTLSHTFRFNSK